MHPQPGGIPWGGRRRNHEEITGFFVALAEHLDIEGFEVQELLARGDTVVVFGRERMRVKSTGRTYETDWVHAWTLRGGSVVAFREYTDTAAILDALRPR